MRCMITCRIADKGQAGRTSAEQQIEKRYGIQLERDGAVLHGLRAMDATTVGYFPKGATAPATTMPWRGYVSPLIGSPFLNEERQFNLMFRTALGAVDVVQELAEFISEVTAAPDLAAALRVRLGKQADDPALVKAIASGERTRILRRCGDRGAERRQPWSTCVLRLRRRCSCSSRMC